MVGMRLASMVFPAPGGADQQDVVASGAGDFERALGGKLSAHVAQIHGNIGWLRRASAEVSTGNRLKRIPAR